MGFEELAFVPARARDFLCAVLLIYTPLSWKVEDAFFPPGEASLRSLMVLAGAYTAFAKLRFFQAFDVC